MTILEVKNLKKYFPVTGGIFLRRTGWVYALDGVSFTLNRGETLGIVGESGCGKTTLGRCIMGLYDSTEGQIIINHRPISKINSKLRKKLALNLQMIFQDPFESLNPRQTVREILEEKYIIHGKKNRKNNERGKSNSNFSMIHQINELIERVGLTQEDLSKFPHEFSGGQRQRIGIARAISLNPEIIICDEPVSALDVSVQSKILNLLLELQNTLSLTYIFISHDLSVVKHISDKIAVMYMGKIVEIADANDIYTNGKHPYTKALLSSIPIPDPAVLRERIILKGEVPSVENPPSGCRFNTRCKFVKDICIKKEPELFKNPKVPNHLTACHFNF
jgi:oligopeptide/dipeptide ABC transporter ATP-binding protein